MGTPMYLNMKSFLNVKSVTFGVILGIGVGKLLNLVIDNYVKNRKNASDIFSDGLFFSPKKLVCTANCSTANGNSYTQNWLPPCNSCSVKHIISLLGKARTDLDICMYLITSNEISEAILELFKKGVRVRIIIDKHMSEDAYGADVVTLRKEYVPIKVIQSSYIMHNKFVVIDKYAVMSGSLNWTRQGLSGNYENVIITADKAVAEKFSNYFQFLWDLKDE